RRLQAAHRRLEPGAADAEHRPDAAGRDAEPRRGRPRPRPARRRPAAHAASAGRQRSGGRRMTARRFDGRGAIVTGAAGGIGAAIAERLAGEGAQVLIADIDGGRADATAADLAGRLGATLLGQACDVGDEAQVVACFDSAAARFGRIDVVVNNAGLMTFKRLDEWSADDWQRVLPVDPVDGGRLAAL